MFSIFFPINLTTLGHETTKTETRDDAPLRANFHTITGSTRRRKCSIRRARKRVQISIAEISQDRHAEERKILINLIKTYELKG